MQNALAELLKEPDHRWVPSFAARALERVGRGMVRRRGAARAQHTPDNPRVSGTDGTATPIIAVHNVSLSPDLAELPFSCSPQQFGHVLHFCVPFATQFLISEIGLGAPSQACGLLHTELAESP